MLHRLTLARLLAPSLALSLALSIAMAATLHLGCSDASEVPMVQQPPKAPQAADNETTAALSAPATPIASLAEWVANARSGSLILRAQDGSTVSASPGLSTKIDVVVTGMIARTAVRQKFRNPSDAWVEGIYVFPLPDDAAVDHMRILTDGRVIEGQDVVNAVVQGDKMNKVTVSEQ